MIKNAFRCNMDNRRERERREREREKERERERENVKHNCFRAL